MRERSKPLLPVHYHYDKLYTASFTVHSQVLSVWAKGGGKEGKVAYRREQVCPRRMIEVSKAGREEVPLSHSEGD